MSKFASLAEYPSRSLDAAEAALPIAWASLHRYNWQTDQSGLVWCAGFALRGLTADEDLRDRQRQIAER